MRDEYTNFAALRKAESRGAFSICLCDRGTRVVVAAPHGGGIEPGTSEIACAIAGEDLSYYLFEGRKRKNNGSLHITSSNFDEPRGHALMRAADRVLTVHGEETKRQIAYLGGRDTLLIAALRTALEGSGYVVREHRVLVGRDSRNICNVGRTRAGAQLELSVGLRRSFFESLSRSGRAKPSAGLYEFSAVVREALHESAL